MCSDFMMKFEIIKVHGGKISENGRNADFSDCDQFKNHLTYTYDFAVKWTV